MSTKHGFFARVSQAASLYGQYSRMSLASQFRFRVDAILRTVAVFVREFASVVIVLLMLQSFTSLGGWTLPETIFLFSFLFLSYGILISFFTSFRDFEGIVHSGQLDRYLLRPQGLMFQLIASKADFLASIGQGSVGIVLFIWAAQGAGMVWNLPNLTFLVMSLISGVLIQGSIFIFFSALNLYTIKTGNTFGKIYYSIRRFAVYPINIFPAAVQAILVFAVPFAFVNYFPAKYLLGKTIQDGWPDWMPWLGLGVGFIMFFAVRLFWNSSIKRYTSAGC